VGEKMNPEEFPIVIETSAKEPSEASRESKRGTRKRPSHTQ